METTPGERCRLFTPTLICLVQTEQRVRELTEMGVAAQLVTIGKKGNTYFKRRPQYKIAGVIMRCAYK